jgi:flagellar assembly factor FliW
MTHASFSSSLDGIVTFADGLPGFEQHRQFVLVASPDIQPFTVMQGVGDGGPSFVAIDPRVVDRGFHGTLDRVERERLLADEREPLLWLAIVAAGEDGKATANLRAPVVINPGSMRGIQVIAADSPYRIDHPLPVE